MEYYQFTFHPVPGSEKDILIALLDNIGFTGFEEEDDAVKAFINTRDFQPGLFEEFIRANGFAYTKETIRETNWNEKWEAGFQPVTICYPGSVKPFVHLRAGFHQKNEDAAFDIDITPKMSFGTGHHATTFLMVEEMSELDLGNRSVIDFGTGTGVLAILAEKLGAAEILAIDHDEWSIENARENFGKNNCTKITLLKADKMQAERQADVILANINLNIILENLPGIKKAGKKGATILFSGILEHDAPVILKALNEHTFTVTGTRNKENWLIIRAKV